MTNDAVRNTVLTTATACYFTNDDWTEHRAYRGTRQYTANSNAALLRLYNVPCSQAISIDRGADQQILFRAGATIEGRRAPGWEWECPGARRLLFVFDEADVIGRPSPQCSENSYDACYRDAYSMF